MRFLHIFQKNLENFDPLEEGAGVSPRSNIESCVRSKISHSGAPTLSFGLKPIIWQDFPEHCMKMKEIGARELQNY